MEGLTIEQPKALKRCVQYDSEGKVVEYSFDLGAIPKTVKEIAKANGWKFKTVIMKKKAMNS